jgi:hypothetical protein
MHRITPAWDEVVRLIASMRARVVSPSLALLRLGSYARQNRVHQALAEIGRIHKTVHILRTLDNEEYRRLGMDAPGWRSAGGIPNTRQNGRPQNAPVLKRRFSAGIPSSGIFRVADGCLWPGPME